MRRTRLKNRLKSWLASIQLVAVSGDTFLSLILSGSADGSNSLAQPLSQGNFSSSVVQQLSCWSQLVVQAYKSSCVVLKVKVKNKCGWWCSVPSKLASVLSLKMV